MAGDCGHKAGVDKSLVTKENNLRTVYRVWCEFDIGNEDRVWSSKKAALKWAKQTIDQLKADGDIDEDYNDLTRGGLIGTKPVEMME